jgi:hypothetical protein
MEQLVEWELAGETEVLEENLLLSRRGGRPATNHVSYATAKSSLWHNQISSVSPIIINMRVYVLCHILLALRLFSDAA